MTPGREPRPLDHLFHQAAQPGDPIGRLCVGLRRQQSEESLLTDDPAAGVEGLDPDVVEVVGPVNRRFRAGLGEVEQHGLGGPGRGLGGHVAEPTRDGLCALRRPQDPEAGVRLRDEQIAVEPVLAVPEEDEVVARQPVEQLLTLLDLARGQRNRLAGESVGDLVHPVPHGRPVVDRGAHVVEDPTQVGLDRVDDVRGGLTVDLHGDERRLAGQRVGVVTGIGETVAFVSQVDEDRVDHEVDPEVETAELHRDRVDEEGEVVGHDHHHRVIVLPAVEVDPRVGHPDRGRSPAPVRGQPGVFGGHAEEVRGAPGPQVGRVDVGVVATQERLVEQLTGTGRRSQRHHLIDHRFAWSVDAGDVPHRPRR